MGKQWADKSIRGTQKGRDLPEPEDEAAEEKKNGKPETREDEREEGDERTKPKVSGRAEMSNNEQKTGN